MKSVWEYRGNPLAEPYFVFIFDDYEKELIGGLFDLQIKHLVNRRNSLRNKLKKEFETEEKYFFSQEGRLGYPFRYTLWEKKRDDKRLERIKKQLEWDKAEEGKGFDYKYSMGKLAHYHHLHNYRLYRELQMYKVREYEDAVKKLDIPYMREIFRRYKESSKDVVLSSRDIKIFLIEYILRWSDSKKYSSNCKLDLVLLQKVKNYLNNLDLKVKIKLMLVLEEIDHFVFVELKESVRSLKREEARNPGVVYEI